MAKDEEKNEEIVDVEQVYTKTEEYIENNKKMLSYVAIAVIAIVGGYFGYKNFYIEPLETEAKSVMFQAENYFRQDSLKKAIYGDNVNPGFIDIIDDYSGTKAASLAEYYLGISYLRNGQFQDAIDVLSEYSSDDEILSAIAIGATGDAYLELGNVEEAISYYKNAANHRDNSFTSPIYLMKAGQVLETKGEYKEALALYKTIKEKYKDSQEAREIDKYIARAEGFEE
jgi:tetratricopeptide (TPR) repeat protein